MGALLVKLNRSEYYIWITAIDLLESPHFPLQPFTFDYKEEFEYNSEEELKAKSSLPLLNNGPVMV